MGRSARKKDDAQELKPMDFDHAIELYKGDIKPNREKIGELAQENSTAFKSIKKNCHIQRKSMNDAIAIHEMEESKRHDYWRGLNGVLKTLGTDLGGNDLVDQAEGKAAKPKARPNLVAVSTAPPPVSDGTETDLADAANAVTGDEPAPGTSAAAIAAMRADHAADKAEEDGFEEAGPEELAKQQGRGTPTEH